MTRRGWALPVVWSRLALAPETARAAVPPALAESTIEAAMRFAAGRMMAAGAVPAVVAQLAEGESRTMTFTKLTVAAASVCAVGFVAAGVGWLGASQAVAPSPQAAPTTTVRENRAASLSNIMTIGLAMHNYAGEHDNRFPSAAIRKDGKPLLSWRVAILPYLEQKALYDQFHLDEPWDGAHNKTLLDQMPAVYAAPAARGEQKSSTYYQVFAGPGALFGGNEGTKLADITDGTAMTIMIAEAAKPVPWTKPEDLPFAAGKPLPPLGGLFEDGFNVGFGDGAARFIKKSISPDALRALITYNGREQIGGDQF